MRTFHQGPRKIAVLDGRLGRHLCPGQAVALVGPSGAGKSTLLHIAGLLETPDGGQVIINGPRLHRAWATTTARACAAPQMGFVYQFHQLLPEFSALENVVMPQMILGRSAARPASAAARAAGAARARRPRSITVRRELSGGEQQRTAIARALANAPRLILADEPTGNLDPKTAEHVFDELIQLIRTHRRRGADRHPQPRTRRAAWTACCGSRTACWSRFRPPPCAERR